MIALWFQKLNLHIKSSMAENLKGELLKFQLRFLKPFVSETNKAVLRHKGKKPFRGTLKAYKR